MAGPTGPTQAPMSLLFDTWLVMHAMTTLTDDALAPVGMSGDDFGLYSLLRRFGPVTPRQISRWTGMRPTTISVALKRLTARGHATHAPNPDDGRSYLVGLSPAGVTAHAAAAPRFIEATARIAADLGPGQVAERLALQRIDAAFRNDLGLDDRPYALAEDTPTAGGQLAYEGAPLTADQERQVRRYIDFVRTESA